jgi:hypothetical protein
MRKIWGANGAGEQDEEEDEREGEEKGDDAEEDEREEEEEEEEPNEEEEEEEHKNLHKEPFKETLQEEQPPRDNTEALKGSLASRLESSRTSIGYGQSDLSFYIQGCPLHPQYLEDLAEEQDEMEYQLSADNSSEAHDSATILER